MPPKFPLPRASIDDNDIDAMIRDEFARIHSRLDRQDQMLERILTHELRISRLEGHVAAVVKAGVSVVVIVVGAFLTLKLGFNK